MNRTLLVEEDLHQARVAVLEDGRLAEILLERPRERTLVGSIFRGVVHRVLPGMQAAFVDIGLERDAFLYVGDIREAASPFDEVELDQEVAELPPIETLLKRGQEIVVQVVKDPLPTKGARVTTQVSLAGRYLVLLPGLNQRGVSRRIADEAERQRLREFAEALEAVDEGIIVRTAAAGVEAEVLAADLAVLHDRWQQIEEHAGRSSGATQLHRELDLPLRAVRDFFDTDVVTLQVQGEAAYERIRQLVADMQPALLPKVRQWFRDEPLFRHFGVEEAIEEALRPRVGLRSGGSIVIHPTEALVAIDVNTGRNVGRRSLEETILATNLEAVEETARQIRLRDLGGILVVDLIDMESAAHRERVFAALEEAMARDRARIRILPISEFGLVQITRKRSRNNLEQQMTERCPYCGGRGLIASLATICLALRAAVLAHPESSRQPLVVRAHPDVVAALAGQESAIRAELEERLGHHLQLESAAELHHERFEIREAGGS